MGSSDGREDPHLIRELLEAPYRFDFFQAVRMLEHCRREQDGKPRDHHFEGHGVGRDVRPGDEAVRFRALPSLSFPAAAVNAIRDARAAGNLDTKSPSIEMIVTFLGLTGPSGALPRHYTEALLQRIREKDFALRDFLDLFNHRLISLFYRAWEKYRLPVSFERSRLDDATGEPDPITLALYCLDGLGTRGLRGRLDVADEVLLHYSGHLAHFPRSALALECLLSDHLDLPVSVLQCQGQWLILEPDDLAFMPSATLPSGTNNQLGVNLVIGERVWDIQSKFRIRVGPLTWREFQSLMPNGTALRPLCQVTRFYAGPTLDFDVQPLLRSDQVRPCRLASHVDEGPYLGWNTWLPRTMVPSHPVDDAVFQLDPNEMRSGQR